MALVLVVDDEKFVRLMIRSALEQKGHTVLEACDGCECLDVVAASHPDVVFVDVFMPKMDGFEAVAELHAKWPNLKIIGMSSGGAQKEMVYLEILETLGADRVMSKPASAKKVQDLVDSVMASAGN